jgi:uncharacterized hydrophobic protein (TIGR00271 family)
LEAIDTTLSDAADAAEKAAPGDPADAVIWDELVARTGEDSGLSVSFQVFLTIACLLAAIGAITNSPVTAVGAMVLGLEFGPLAAIAVGLVLRRADLVGRGAVALGIGFPIAMAVTAMATVVFDATGLVATSDLDHLDQVDFINKVGPFSFIVALLAGAAGMVALNSAKSAALVGGVHLGDDGAGRGFRVRRAHRGPVPPSRAVRAATCGQPCRNRRRRGGRTGRFAPGRGGSRGLRTLSAG